MDVARESMGLNLRVIALFAQFSLHVKVGAGSRLDVLCVLCELVTDRMTSSDGKLSWRDFESMHFI